MADKQLQQISIKLDSLVRLVALSLVAGKKQKEQCLFLSNAGFQPKQIAEIIGTSANVVSVTLSAMRREKTKG